MKFQIRSQIKDASSQLSRALLGMLLLGGSAHATALFHVTVNTASLIGNSSAPFSVDFQFNNGSVLGNNAAIVNNFNYSGGSAVGSPSLFGGALGNASSSITFDNSAPFQELFQTFTPGGTLRFDVFLTTNVDAVTPDLFAFSILDKNLFNIPTTGLADSLWLVNLNSTTLTSGVAAAGTGAFSGVSAAATVPEPGSYILVLAGLPFLILAARRKHSV